ncbi:MAG TPA: hypothetical protein DIW77_20270, partial [Chromatiaceae bacterium]|nr:hypothetical protein [Chromatiaceae bacterium]
KWVSFFLSFFLAFFFGEVKWVSFFFSFFFFFFLFLFFLSFPHQRSTSAGRYSWLACAVGMKMLTSVIRTTRPIPTAQFVAG